MEERGNRRWQCLDGVPVDTSKSGAGSTQKPTELVNDADGSAHDLLFGSSEEQPSGPGRIKASSTVFCLNELQRAFQERIYAGDGNAITIIERVGKPDELDLRMADLSGCDLTEINLRGANLNGSNLKGTILRGADLICASLREADLTGANLSDSFLSGADLFGAFLQNSNLNGAQLVRTDFRRAVLSGSSVFGVSAWAVNLDGAQQHDLVIMPNHEGLITTDNLAMAQFLYLLLSNGSFRTAIDTLSAKAVLILGSFGSNRKPVLDSIKDELRRRNYLPVLFDFGKPRMRDLTETVSILAHMAKFVIADITDARSISQELMTIVPHLPSVPIQPLLIASQREYGMFEHFRKFPWVLLPVVYRDSAELLQNIQAVIAPAEERLRRVATST